MTARKYEIHTCKRLIYLNVKFLTLVQQKCHMAKRQAITLKTTNLGIYKTYIHNERLISKILKHYYM